MIPGLWGFSGRLVIEAQYWFGHLTQGGLRVYICLGSIKEQTLLCGQRGLCLMGKVCSCVIPRMVMQGTELIPHKRLYVHEMDFHL